MQATELKWLEGHTHQSPFSLQQNIQQALGGAGRQGHMSATAEVGSLPGIRVLESSPRPHQLPFPNTAVGGVTGAGAGDPAGILSLAKVPSEQASQVKAKALVLRDSGTNGGTQRLPRRATAPARGKAGLSGRNRRKGAGWGGAHCVVIRVQVGHEHGSEGAQDPVHLVSVVTTQLPERAFATVQEQGPVGAMDESDSHAAGRGFEVWRVCVSGRRGSSSCVHPTSSRTSPNTKARAHYTKGLISHETLEALNVCSPQSHRRRHPVWGTGRQNHLALRTRL